MRYFLIFSLLFLLAACGPGGGFQVSSINPRTDISDTSAPSNSTAFELYSWHNSRGWSYVLFETATKVSSFAELANSDDTIIGTDEMTERLIQLPKGTKVYWNLKRIKGFSLPDKKILDKVSSAASKAGVTLEIISWPV